MASRSPLTRACFLARFALARTSATCGDVALDTKRPPNATQGLTILSQRLTSTAVSRAGNREISSIVGPDVAPHARRAAARPIARTVSRSGAFVGVAR